MPSGGYRHSHGLGIYGGSQQGKYWLTEQCVFNFSVLGGWIDGLQARAPATLAENLGTHTEAYSHLYLQFWVSAPSSSLGQCVRLVHKHGSRETLMKYN